MKTEHIRFVCALTAALILSACTGHSKPSNFTTMHRPRGYNWQPAKAPGTGNTVWYGTDPETLKTVYVGPDGIYYTFNHKPPIRKDDLTSKWDPHDAPGYETGATP